MNNFVITGSDDRTVRVWNLFTKKQEFVLRGHKSIITCLASSRDNKFIVSGSLDRKVLVINLQSHRIEAAFDSNEYPAKIVAISDDNKFVMAGFLDTIKVWNLERKMIVSLIKGYSYKFRSLIMSPGNKFVIFCSDQKISVFRTPKLEN